MSDLEVYYLTRTWEMFKKCLDVVGQEDLTPKLEYAINELELIINWVAKR
jgi:hypothetical protein